MLFYAVGVCLFLPGTLLAALGVQEADLCKRMKFLSHGTKQKIGLVIAMQHNPSLLLLDEPSTGLDPLVQIKLRDLLRDLSGRGTAVFFSSHVLSEVEALCSRVAILRTGSLVAVETIDHLRAAMLRRMIVRFRGTVPPRFASLPGITHVESTGREVTCRFSGDINLILRELAGAGIEDLVFPEPQLEDIFLAYYKANT
jgi:ABC-2 type transport system ATP-binding protein